MHYRKRGYAASAEHESMVELWECENCGALVGNTTAHDRHHADLESTARDASTAYSHQQPLG
jgi:hypothetical protein